MLSIGVCEQVKKLKSLCENLFKLGSIKLRLFLHEEVREKIYETVLYLCYVHINVTALYFHYRARRFLHQSMTRHRDYLTLESTTAVHFSSTKRAKTITYTLFASYLRPLLSVFFFRQNTTDGI